MNFKYIVFESVNIQCPGPKEQCSSNYWLYSRITKANNSFNSASCSTYYFSKWSKKYIMICKICIFYGVLYILLPRNLADHICTSILSPLLYAHVRTHTTKWKYFLLFIFRRWKCYYLICTKTHSERDDRQSSRESFKRKFKINMETKIIY